jgi:MGT family glycosyltransferase
MRFLFNTLPTSHFNFTVPIAQILRSKEHEVAYATGKRLKDVIEEEGFKFYEAWPDIPFHHTDEYYLEAQRKLNLPLPRHARLTAKLLQPIAPHIAADIEAVAVFIAITPTIVERTLPVIEKFKPDVLIFDSAVYAAPIIGKLTRIPWATISHFPNMIPDETVPPPGSGLPSSRNFSTMQLNKAVNRLVWWYLRRFDSLSDRNYHTFGLSPTRDSILKASLSPFLFIGVTSPIFEVPSRSFPPQVHLVGPSVWNKSKNVTTPKWLDDLPKDKPIVHVTLGTNKSRLAQRLLTKLIKELSVSDLFVILSAGANRELIQNIHTPPNFVITEYVPHQQLLPKVNTVVHHGGLNTTMAVLFSGLPSVIIPLAYDQPDNAQRCVELGVAIRLDPVWHIPGSLRRSVFEVLENPAYKQRALQVKEALSQQNGPQLAANLLICLAETGDPVLRSHLRQAISAQVPEEEMRSHAI